WSIYASLFFVTYTLLICYMAYSFFFVQSSLLQKAFFIFYFIQDSIFLFFVIHQCARIYRNNAHIELINTKCCQWFLFTAKSNSYTVIKVGVKSILDN